MRSVTEFVYLACLIAAVALMLDGQRERSALMPAAQFFDTLMHDRAPRVTILLFWWWLGWHFLVADTLAG
ncbi:DUF6186 family protein [Ruicaihuangia caeni]|uniref:DUF6186 family protein n=1 Tax=Ruicaihuangia caeni TaxID=3042517 RepID=A0AAW6T213_9MICO|nr:DUF6186 family protein [Klugiella sp. YN-L-19]MDI2097851.1 DUF6186 family protein [Klugiella sp. YN-L-19]